MKLTSIVAAHGGLVADGCGPRSAVAVPQGLVEVDLEAPHTVAKSVVVVELNYFIRSCRCRWRFCFGFGNDGREEEVASSLIASRGFREGEKKKSMSESN